MGTGLRGDVRQAARTLFNTFLAPRIAARRVLERRYAGTGRAGAGRPLISLQCYEGLDEAKALYEWDYAKQMLYTQLLRDAVVSELAGAPNHRRKRRKGGQERRGLF